MIRWLTTYCAVQNREELEQATACGLPEPPTEWATIVIDLASVYAFRPEKIDDEAVTLIYTTSGEKFYIRLPFVDFDAAHTPWRGV